MPKIPVNGVEIAYEIFGQGPPLVWTPGGWLPRKKFTYLFAGRFSSRYRVLIWDRRNTGASDIAIEDSPSVWHLWADDLHYLLDSLNMCPAYLGGGSAGSVLSLLMAHRYPEDVKGLLLTFTPTDDVEILQGIATRRYYQLAEVAEKKGMQVLIETSKNTSVDFPEWIAESIRENPGNQDRLLNMDPKKFATIIRKWESWFTSGCFYRAGLTEEEIRNITVPAIIAHGFNQKHPEQTAAELHRLLPNAEWVAYSDRYSSQELHQIRQSDSSIQRIFAVLPYYEEFLERIETIFRRL
jgi:pimeloyl-ACP methyl ester carboxylesterase